MEQVLKPNLVTYKRVYNMPFFMTIMFFIPMLFIRLHTFPAAPGLNLSLAEPLFFISFVLLILDKWDLNKVFGSSFTNYYLFFLAYGIWSCFMGLKYYHNSAGFSLGVFRNLFLYPLAFFLGYHYITDIKHFKNYHRIIQLIFFLYFPLSVFYYVTHYGEHGSYLQFFDHYEGWVVSFLIYYALSNFFIYKRVYWFDKLLAAGSTLMIILTNRRGIWVSTFCSTFVIYYLSVRTISFAYMTKIILWIGLAIGSFYVLTKVAPDNFIIKSVNDRVIQTIANLQDPTEFGQNSIAWRLLVYQASLKEWEKHPIFGQGIGFEPTVVFPKGADLYNEREGVAFHDIIVALLATSGVIGLLLFAIMHLKFVFRVLKEKNDLEGETKPYVIGMFGMYVASLIWALASNDLWSNANLIIIMYTLRGAIIKQFDLARDAKLEAAINEKPAINHQVIMNHEPAMI